MAQTFSINELKTAEFKTYDLSEKWISVHGATKPYTIFDKKEHNSLF